MAYRTILLHWEDAGAPARAADLAAALARRFDAHLTILGFGVEPGLAAYGFGGPAAGALAYEVEGARTQAAERRDEAEAWLAAAAVRGEVRAITCSIDLIGETVGKAARLADLVVLAQPYGGAREDVAVRALEGALFDGAAPVLVCPEGLTAAPGRRILVAWDGGLEAVHAVRGAMGFLAAAEAVEVVLIDPDPGFDGEAEPGADLARLLSRHGIAVTLAQVPSAGRSVAEVLSRRLVETGADLLVMGAYGHSRFRQAILGGTTRSMLEQAPVPVFMAR